MELCEAYFTEKYSILIKLFNNWKIMVVKYMTHKNFNLKNEWRNSWKIYVEEIKLFKTYFKQSYIFPHEYEEVSEDIKREWIDVDDLSTQLGKFKL